VGRLVWADSCGQTRVGKRLSSYLIKIAILQGTSID
jgi:hypothetical protein